MSTPSNNVYWRDLPKDATIRLVGSCFVASWPLKVYKRHAVAWWYGSEARDAQGVLTLLVDKGCKVSELSKYNRSVFN